MEQGKILITGANGLLGQAMVSVFTRESDFEIIKTSVEPESFVRTGLQYIQLDITNKDELKKTVSEINPCVIINCAAFTDVDKCETERELSWKINVDAVKNLIIAARPVNAKLVHFSTDYVFDGKNGPYDEQSVPNPLSFYGRGKLASENALIASGIEHAIIRTMVLFGYGVNVKPNFAMWLVNKLSAKEKINIVDDQIGNSTIADDLAYGTLKVVEKEKTGIYNIAGRDIESRLDFTMKLCDVYGYDKSLINRIKTKDLNQPAPRPLNSGLITLKAETELGFRPMNTVEALQLLKFNSGF
ncbi:MAG: dTDP-4-dehydrorhamnose reductase [Ignavibacteria bacterium]|nr:dTDP-4-dehydrorhamnose reductase [Ignavibacteria bacterium]